MTDVLGMTLYQVRAFSRAALRRWRDDARAQLRAQALAARAAQYDRPGFQKFLRSLEGKDRGDR